MQKRELPFETTIYVRDTCVCLFLQRATRVVARHFDDALRPLDLTNQQFSLLMALNRPASPIMADVARWLAMDRTTLTANLKPLQRRNLVRIVVDDSDRRSRKLAITSAGRMLLAKAFPVWKRAHAEVDALLGTGGPDRLRKDLRAISHAKAAIRPMSHDTAKPAA